MKLLSIYIFIIINLFSPISYAEKVPDSSDNTLVFEVIQNQLVLNNANIESAVLINGKNGVFSGLQIKLKASAAKELERITTNNLGKQANLILNKKIISTSTIKSSLGNKFLITGISKEDAEDFIKSFSALAIPT